MDELTLTLDSPITEEQWDQITDVDFDHTNRIFFKTKHGKEVYFAKEKHGHWVWVNRTDLSSGAWVKCSECDAHRKLTSFFENYCPNCGAKMDEEIVNDQR